MFIKTQHFHVYFYYKKYLHKTKMSYRFNQFVYEYVINLNNNSHSKSNRFKKITINGANNFVIASTNDIK